MHIKWATVGIFWDRVQSWCIMNSKSTSQWPSGRNVSPHCGVQCWLTLFFFFTLSTSAFFLFLSPLFCCCFPLLPLAGKVKQEPSVYREGPPYQRRGSLQLWQFLVTLLDDPANGHFIAWTGRGMEFKLIEPEEVSPHCPQLVYVFCPVLLLLQVCSLWIHVDLIACVVSGGSSLGYPEEQTSHELWQAEPLPALLLREGHHAEGKGTSTLLFSLPPPSYLSNFVCCMGAKMI